MSTISGSAMTDSPRPRDLGMFLTAGITVLLGIALALFVVNRWLAFEVEEGPGGNSVTLLSPLGKFPVRGNRSLLLSVYPDSKLIEQTTLDWMDGSETSTKSRRQLTVLACQTGASLKQISSWYQKELGSGFRQSNGWTTEESEKASSWLHRVEPRSQPQAIIFRQELPHRVRGVLILPESAGQGSKIKLYDYMESPGQ